VKILDVSFSAIGAVVDCSVRVAGAIESWLTHFSLWSAVMSAIPLA
jgi:hypothetical protein